MTDRTLDEDADSAAEAGEESEPKRGGKKKKLLIIGGGVVLLLAITAGVLFFTGFLGKGETETAAASAQEAAPQPVKPGVFFDLPDLLVNLNSNGRRASFLKISVSLELESQADVSRLQAVMPRVIDNFQVYLRELRVEDLRGSAGVYRLREELLVRVNSAAAPVKVRDVLFKEMLVQ
ncbi:MAG TPA: flagellar basal body-associated FliL family protein [Stellaceae bacterium]|nr:flagellar basal body-associated FliL family protein [Stellaceae bacterium]HYC12769.1 flagellar basal body-associated FliL family protein [Stellaceae bacterium]